MRLTGRTMLPIHAFLAGIGGLLYMGIELIWRGHTHWTMGVLGGVCFILIGLINEVLPQDTPLVQQMAAGALLVTAAELLAGLLLNRWLGLAVWDYSDMPLNLWGQVCAPYTILWFFLSLPAIVAEDWMHHVLHHADMPQYRFV